MAGKRVSLASLAGAKVEAVPGAGRPDLIHVHPDTVAPTPLNPRRNFDQTELAELGEDMRSGQLQPCVAVPKASYLKLYPEHADQLPDGCRHVMAAGERRWRAAAQAGLDTLDVLIRHDLTESRIRFLAAVLSENVQRANFNPIEEANGLRAMLELHDGNQSAAAQAMGKSKAWFNQRIGLLRLTDDMVQLVLEGKLTAFRDMRRYASLPRDEQYAAWKADQDKPAVPPVKPTLKAVPDPPTYTAVYADGPPPADPVPPPGPNQSGPADYHAVIIPGGDSQQTPAPPAPTNPPPAPAQRQGLENVPEPRPVSEPTPEADPETIPEGRKLPYHDGPFIGQHLARKMDEAAFVEAVQVMTSACWDKAGPGPSFDILRSMLEAAEERDRDKLLPLLKGFLPDVVDRPQS